MKQNKFNKNPKAILIIFILTCLFCCKKNAELNTNIKSFNEFEKNDSLSFENLYNFKEGIVGMMHLVDSTLIIFNPNGEKDYFFYNYNLKKEKLSKGYLPGGRGPTEALGVIATGINNNTLWAYDVTLKKILTLKMSDSSSFLFKEYPIKEFYNMIDFKDSTHFFGIGAENSIYKIQEVDINSNNRTQEFGTFAYIPKGVSIESYKSAYGSFIYRKPSGEKIVLAYKYIDGIEIFNLKTQKSILIQGPEGIDIDLNQLKIGMVTPNTKRTFVSGTVTNEYIYLLYSGNLLINKNSYFGNMIFVYDWEGNPVKKIKLNKEITALTVSNNNDIYAYDPNTGYIIKSIIN